MENHHEFAEEAAAVEKKPKGWIGRKLHRLREIREKYAKISAKEREIRRKRREKIRERRKHMMRDYLSRAGLEVREEKIRKLLFNACVVINLVISAYMLYFFTVKTKASLLYVFVIMTFVWVLLFLGVIIIVWLMFYLMLDFRIFTRSSSIEEVLADFLQLTSANIRAGMSIDKALWFSVRPRFGVLANEIEIVAKETMSGKDLETALFDFTRKYDSQLLKRSVSLLIEGLQAGGEVGELLNKISANISEARLMKKEMSANVTTYVIFITFATVVAAPVLFALSNQLLLIIGNLVTTIGHPAGGAASSFASAFSTLAIQPQDFEIFALVMLITTSFFSACIIAIIRRGSVKGGLKYIPTFMIIAVILFYIANYLLSKMLAGMVVV